jgi:hypothetical protein
MAGYRLDNHIVSESRGVSSFRMVPVGQLAGENTFKYCYVESKLWKRREKKVETMTSIACALPNTNQKSCHVRIFYAQWEDVLSSIHRHNQSFLQRSWISCKHVTRENDLYAAISAQALLEINAILQCLIVQQLRKVARVPLGG